MEAYFEFLHGGMFLIFFPWNTHNFIFCQIISKKMAMLLWSSQKLFAIWRKMCSFNWEILQMYTFQFGIHFSINLKQGRCSVNASHQTNGIFGMKFSASYHWSFSVSCIIYIWKRGKRTIKKIRTLVKCTELNPKKKDISLVAGFNLPVQNCKKNEFEMEKYKIREIFQIKMAYFTISPNVYFLIWDSFFSVGFKNAPTKKILFSVFIFICEWILSLQFQEIHMLKFSFSEKATKISRNRPQNIDITK